MDQQGSRKVRPERDQVCSIYKVLHDLCTNQNTQGLHSMGMLNCKLTCAVFYHNGLLPAVHLHPPETCPPCPSIGWGSVAGILEEDIFVMAHYVSIVKHDSLDKAPLNDEAIRRQQKLYGGNRLTPYKVYILSRP
jgi:hypothetical protein